MAKHSTIQTIKAPFPYFGGIATPHFKSNAQQGGVNRVKVPAVRLRLGKEGDERRDLVGGLLDDDKGLDELASRGASILGGLLGSRG